MKIILTLEIPNDILAGKLEQDGMTVEEFKQMMKENLNIDATELCDGASATIAIED
jgi:hypothetical protein